MGNPKASIIVPVYNSALVVGRCLESLMAQTCAEIEIICVNDGSSDDSSKVIGSYVERDHRIILLEQSNGGVSAARNSGIAASHGDVVFFVDADDYIEAQTVECVLRVMKSENAEVVVFGGVCEPEDQASKRIRQLMSPESRTFETCNAELLFHSNSQPYACRAAFSKALLDRKDIRFPSGLALGEDVVFLFDSFVCSGKTVLMPEKFYHYVMDSGSATHEFNDNAARSKKLDAHILMLQMLLRDWQELGCLNLFPGDLITWFLDLVVFDLARLDNEQYSVVSSRIDKLFSCNYGSDWARIPRKSAVRRVARKLASKGGATVTLADAVGFYIASRGIKACIDRFL